MRTVILASHGHLASGMKNTVEMILGEQEALKAFDAYTTPECNVHDTLEATENASSLRMCWAAA